MAALHPGFTNHELNILWEHRDRIIDAITDPDGLAEEACKLDLMHPETKDMLVSLPVDMKTKAGSLLQSIEGKIRGQPILFHHFLALLKKLPGLADLGAILRNTYDEKVTACVESTNCIDGSTIHIRRDASSCMDQDKYSAIAMQQEDNGRSGGSSDNVNNTGSKKVDDIPKLHELERFEQCSLIIRIIDRVAPKWKGVALRLYFEDHCIEVNEMNCHYQAVPACRTMFTRWLEGYGRKPTTWRTLIIALKEENLYTLAEELEKMFQDLLSTTVSNQSSSSEAPAVVSRKRHLEKSAEEASEKRPCPESNASETNSVNPLLVSIEVTKINPLLKHRPKLAAFYSHQPEVPEGTWPPVKKTQYINLALIRTEQAIDFNKDFLRQTIRGSVDDIIKDKDDIKYADVFTEVEEGARLVFEGRPGCGKTTMMNKVSQDWAMWRILSSSLLFLVHLRRFGNRSDIDLETILHSTPVDFSDEEFQEICRQIESNQGKGVVFALDGLDEYCPEKKERKTTFIHKLIKGEVLPKSIVIVASRPAASLRYRRNATKCIEVLGFLKEQIYEYIDSYFHEIKDKDSLVVGLKTYLEHHPNVMHMCYLPLHMAMVTYLFEVEGASLPQTETEIYRHFTLSTLLRSIRKRDEIDDEEEFYFSSFDDLQPEDKEIFDCILNLAYQATVIRPQQVFSAEDVRKFTDRQSNNSENNENSLGLVVIDKYFVRYGLKEIYTFLHYTFQEYLSACHIVRLSPQAQEKIIVKYGGDKKLGVVWKFYCGMTQFSEEQKVHNFEQLFEKTKYDILLQLHCAHESQQDILCTHTVKSYGIKIVLNSSSLNPADFTALGYVLTHSNVPATELAITSCNIGPEGISALAKAIDTSSLTLKTLSFHGTKVKKVIPQFCSVLKKCPQLCTLILSSCGIIKKVLSEMDEMLSMLESVEQLDLSCNDLGIKSVEVLEQVLKKLPNLKNLVWIKGLLTSSLLKCLIIRDIEINLVDSKNSKSPKQLQELLVSRLQLSNTDKISTQALVKGLQHCINLEELKLDGNNIGDAGAQALAEGLQHCTNLQKLDLEGNNIGDAGAQALAESLQHCTNLQKLDLEGNNIGDAGAQALAESLQHCTNLKELFLWKNSFGVAGAQSLAEVLPHCTNLQNLKGKNIDDAGALIVAKSLQYYTNIRDLDLRENNLGDAGAQALAESLHHCTNLQKLDLRENNLGDAGAQALSKGLHRTNLQKLDLMDNNIGDPGAQALAKGLQHCTDLKELHLWKNNIGVAGAQALAEGLPHCTNPQNLYLRYKNIGDAGAQFLAISLQYHTDVQNLDLQYNNIGDAGAQALAKGLQHCTNLQKLDLYWNYIGDAGAQALAGGLQHCTNLQELSLGKNSIGVPGAQALAGCLQHCINLQKLDLQDNNIGVAGAQALAKGLQHCPNLQELDLWGNTIGDAGAQALAKGLQHYSNLQKLNLWGNNIGDAGAQTLAEGLQHCSNLQTLYLINNSLTDRSVDSLSQLIRRAKQLKELYLYRNKFTDDDLRALRAAAEERKSDFAKLNLGV